MSVDDIGARLGDAHPESELGPLKHSDANGGSDTIYECRRLSHACCPSVRLSVCLPVCLCV